ncbi:MAG: hypothetical protein RSE36_00365 [Oscillospiraceae bacterium]
MSESIKIELLEECELVRFRDFCREHWGSEHPLVHNDAMFSYYYRNGGSINFVVAKEEEKDEILSVCGFIYANSSQTPDVWISFILTKKGAPHAIGFRILEFIQSLTHCRTIACNNIRKKTRGLYEFFGWFVGDLTQYYRLNKAVQKYTICHIEDNNILSVKKSKLFFDEITAEKELDSFEFERYKENRPYKDKAYIKRRYLDNPWLSYRIFAGGDEAEGKCALLVLRIVESGSARMVRVVDYVGDRSRITDCGELLDKIMASECAEFCDWYAFGIGDEVMSRAGFSKRAANDANILPNYLEPILMENVDFAFFTSDANNYCVFKADGDQDRPNLSK